MNVNVDDITITSLETITAFKLSGEYRFTLDELQDLTIAQSEDKTDITGKGGRKLNSLKKNKAVKISGTNGLMSGGLLETQVGNAFAKKDSTIRWTDYLTVTSNSAATSYKAIGSAGSEIIELYVKNTNGTLGTKLDQAATAASGKFAYAPTTKALTFSGLTDGTEVVVFYDRKVSADVLENVSDVYSEKLTLYVDAFGEDKCGNLYRVQIYIPKADFAGTFDMVFGGDQSTHKFEAESLSGACGAGGTLWTYTVFGSTAADVA